MSKVRSITSGEEGVLKTCGDMPNRLHVIDRYIWLRCCWLSFVSRLVKFAYLLGGNS